MWWLLLLVVAVSVIGALDPVVNPCQPKLRCHECLQTAGCAWCFSNNSSYVEKTRCFPFEDSKNPSFCKDSAVNFVNNATILKSKKLTKSGSSSKDQVVQIWPQKINLKLRVNTPLEITIKYAQAEDFPLDLYYLMDLTSSMNDDMNKLRTLGLTLVNEMKNITSNLRLGFGSFMDKTVHPFHSYVIDTNRYRKDASFGFRNNLRLTDDIFQFDKILNSVGTIADAYEDAPEGSLEAALQAVVCREQVGWRNSSRRLLLITTDDGFHTAGDGKLAGLIVPNDGKCHLNSKKEYNYNNQQDYPSVSQVKEIVEDNDIHVIFAVTKENLPTYSKLSQEIRGSKVAELKGDSSNIVELIKEQYNEIRSTVELEYDAPSEISVQFESNCLDGTDKQYTSKCSGLPLGAVVTFTAVVELTRCPPGLQVRRNVTVWPVGISERLELIIEPLCDCACESPGHEGYIPSAQQCSGNGTLQCGVCECAPGREGRACECASDDMQEGGGNVTLCIRSKEELLCSGRGECRCGQCECDQTGNPSEKIYGKFCECDNFSCELNNKQICSGPDHGICECGKCKCLPGWGGPACQCHLSEEPCRPPNGGALCSDHGDCVCGECKCGVDERGRRYLTPFCERCTTCQDRCFEFQPCMECLAYSEGPLKNTCKQNCSQLQFKVQEDIKVEETSGENLCEAIDDAGCHFKFVYSYNFHNNIETRIQLKKECPKPINLLVAVLGVVGTILLLGLATIILWKVLTSEYDRREFIKFQKEILNAKWTKNQNPLYVNAVSNFSNPAYLKENS